MKFFIISSERRGSGRSVNQCSNVPHPSPTGNRRYAKGPVSTSLAAVWEESLRDSLRLGRFLGENPEDKVGLLVRLKGGGDDDVLAGRQPQPRADLPQVDEELRARAGGVREEKVTLEVDPGLAGHLGRKRRRGTSTQQVRNTPKERERRDLSNVPDVAPGGQTEKNGWMRTLVEEQDKRQQSRRHRPHPLVSDPLH